MNRARHVIGLDDDFDRIDAHLHLGNKATSLRRLAGIGLPVPDAVTITIDVCVSFLRNGELPPDLVEEFVSRTRSLRNKRASFGKPNGTVVAVRSGASQSMPGMLVTLLGCGLNQELIESSSDSDVLWQLHEKFIAGLIRSTGNEVKPTSAPVRERCALLKDAYREMTRHEFPDDVDDQLVVGVKTVLDSWNRDECQAYRAANNLEHLEGTSVTIQAMNFATVSGVALSRDPFHAGSNVILVEAIAGLGDQLVAGRISPDELSIDRTTLASEGGSCERLSERQLRTLAKHVLRIEAEFSGPVDVEWAFDGDDLAILQARKLDCAMDVDVLMRDESDRLMQMNGKTERLWVRHNLAETLPHPTPMSLSVVKRMMSFSGAFGELYRRLGFAPASSSGDDDPILTRIGGEIYTDANVVPNLFATGLPMSYTVDELKRDPTCLDEAPRHFDPEKTDHWTILRIPHWLFVFARTKRRVRRQTLQAERRFEDARERFERFVGRERNVELQQLSLNDLRHRMSSLLSDVVDRFAVESLLPGTLGSIAFYQLRRELESIFSEGEAEDWAVRILTQVGIDPAHDPMSALQQRVHGELSHSAFVSRFGHRAVEEMELATPRWHEQIDQFAEWPSSALRGTSSSVAELDRDVLRRQLADYGATSLWPNISRLVGVCERLLPYRERGKHFLMMGFDLLRQTLLELAQRWRLKKDDIFFLEVDELGFFQKRRAALSSRIESRRRHWNAWKRVQLPTVIATHDLPLKQARATESARGAHFSAKVISRGLGEGVVFHMDGANSNKRGVLVSRFLTPSITPCMLDAAAVVVETGGVLSHAGLVARQHGVPVVVCPAAVEQLADGMRVVVDAIAGRVTLVDDAAVANTSHKAMN